MERESTYHPFNKKTDLYNKYRYIKHKVGVDQREVWVKIPNIAYMEKIILARKLLRMKYSLESHHAVKLDPKTCNERLKKRLSTKSTNFKFADRRVKQEITRKWKKCNQGRGNDVQADDRRHSADLTASNFQEVQDDSENENGESTNIKTAEEIKKNQMSKELWSAFHTPDVLEVWANMKMFPEKGGSHKGTTLLVRLMEIMRIGVYKHDWLLVSKCAEGLANEAKRSNSSAYWILWNGGFLALVNAYKNDMDKVIDLGLQTRLMMSCFPLRLAVELATWLTQHGQFQRGVQLIEDWSKRWSKSLTCMYTVKRNRENPKRYQIELLSSLFLAARAYAEWKRDMNLLHQCRYYEGDRKSILQSKGEAALLQFQLVAQWAQKADAEITIFIEPFIELTVECRSKLEARKIFLNYVEKYRTNYVLQELYIKFLEKYFPLESEEIEIFSEGRKRYTFRKCDYTTNLMTLRTWRDNIVRRSKDTTFKSIQIPASGSSSNYN